MIVVDLNIHREMAKLMKGGVPVGHLALVTGGTSVGKSTLSMYTNKELDICQRLEEFSFAGMGNIPKQLEAIELMNAAAETIRRLRNGSPESKN